MAIRSILDYDKGFKPVGARQKRYPNGSFNKNRERKGQPDRPCVYFVRADGTQNVKIGSSTHIGRRMHHLQCVAPQALIVVGAIYCFDRKQAYAVEFEIHRKLSTADRRQHGEWFKLNETEVRGIVTSFERDPRVKSIGHELSIGETREVLEGSQIEAGRSVWA